MPAGISSGCGGKSALDTSEADAGTSNTFTSGSPIATTSTGWGQGGAAASLGTDTTIGGRATAAVGGVPQTSVSLANGDTSTSENVAVGGSGVLGAGGDAPSAAGSGTAANGGAGGHSSTARESGGSANGGASVNQAGAAGAALPEECFPVALRAPNVMVHGDATPTGAAVGGILWVGGDAKFSWYSVGTALGNSCGDYGLVVGGDLSGQVNAGQTAASIYGRTADTTVTACALTEARVVDFDAVSTTALELSTRLKVLPANGSSSRIAGILTLSGGNETLNVFSLTAADLLDNGRMHFGVPESSTVLVNVSGESIRWATMAFLLPNGKETCGETACAKILYNLYEATELELTSINIYGSVLAPKATLSGGHTNLYGQVFVESLLGQIEYHPYLFGGCLQQ